MTQTGEKSGSSYDGIKPGVLRLAYLQNESFDIQKRQREKEQMLIGAEDIKLALLATSEWMPGDDLIAAYASILEQYSDYRRLLLLEETLALQPFLVAGEPIMPKVSVLEIDTIVRPADYALGDAQPWIDEANDNTLAWRVQTRRHLDGIVVDGETLVGHDAIMQRLTMPTDAHMASGVDKLGTMADMYEAIGETTIGQEYRERAALLARTHLLNARSAFVPDLAKDILAIDRVHSGALSIFLDELAVNIATDDYSRKYYGANLKQLEAIVYINSHRLGAPDDAENYVVDRAEVTKLYQELKAKGEQLLAERADEVAEE